MNIVAIIPTIDPDERLLTLIDDLQARSIRQVIVVDDGSDDTCAPLFCAVERRGARVVHHAANLGKGCALKSGFTAVRSLYPNATHVVTVDGDGQHLPDDIVQICKAADGHHDHIVIGIRDLTSKGVPLRSRIGNAFSSAYFKFDTGMSCPDTQTGLRVIPASLLGFALSIPGTRYEYEMNFLTAVAKQGIPLAMMPITTVYENGNETSHFSPIKDSVRIYRQFLRFAGSSLGCSAIDLGLFAAITALFDLDTAALVALATVVARLASGLVNFSLNRNWSFSDTGSKKGAARSQALRYFTLFAAQMLASMGLVTALSFLPVPLVAVKVLVDATLFVVSYFIQRNWVFKAPAKPQPLIVKGVSYAKDAQAQSHPAA